MELDGIAGSVEMDAEEVGLAVRAEVEAHSTSGMLSGL